MFSSGTHLVGIDQFKCPKENTLKHVTWRRGVFLFHTRIFFQPNISLFTDIKKAQKKNQYLAWLPNLGRLKYNYCSLPLIKGTIIGEWILPLRGQMKTPLHKNANKMKLALKQIPRNVLLPLLGQSTIISTKQALCINGSS